MSLINKMLQDLESRKNSQAEAASKKSVYEDLEPVKASGIRAPSRRLNSILLAIVVVGAGAYAWKQWGERLILGEPTPVKPPPVAMHKTLPKPAPAPQPAPQAVVATVPAPVANEAATQPTAAPPVTNEQLGHAVPSAKDEARTGATPPPTAAKMTPAPAKSNAVAGADTDYWTVSRGETLYGISTKTGIDPGNLSNWNHLTGNHVIYPGQRLRLTPPSASEAMLVKKNEPQKKAAKKAKVTVVAVAKPPAGKNAPQAGPTMVETPEVNSTDTGVMDKKVKPLSPDEKAESEYRLAVNQLQKGRAGDAEKLLKSALKASAEHTRARELLTGLTLQNGRWREAEQILEEGVEKVPAYYPFAQLLARVYVEHGSDQRALTVMEESRRAGAGNADYLGFLAALYQRTGKHQEAITAYTEAIKLVPTEGRSWLGMGISLEAIQNWNAAGEAYQRAIDTGTLDDNLLKYSRQRLAVVKNK